MSSHDICPLENVGMGLCHYNQGAFSLALTCLDGAVKVRKHQVSKLTHSSDIIELYEEEVALAADFFNSGNTHMQLGDYAQAMQCFIQSRDLRWRHVGGGIVEKILDRYLSEMIVDEDELLGLAHCLHNIGVVFDIKKDYQRARPHYEEALAIKNAIAGLNSTDIEDQANPDDSRALVLQTLTCEDDGYCKITKATLSASVTRHKIAMVYVKVSMLTNISCFASVRGPLTLALSQFFYQSYGSMITLSSTLPMHCEFVSSLECIIYLPSLLLC
jgi:tetratricopeptide (TPR) repeat protein